MGELLNFLKIDNEHVSAIENYTEDEMSLLRDYVIFVSSSNLKEKKGNN